MDKFLVISDSCEYCAREYIQTETDKLAGLPDNQEKSAKINQIIHNAMRATTKPVVKLSCRNNDHTYCKDHLYKMIDAIGEYIDDCHDTSLS